MKRLYLVVLAIFAITFAMAKDSYIPTMKPNKEYIYTNGYDTTLIKTRMSDVKEGYVVFNAWNEDEYPLPDRGIFKDDGPLVLQYMADWIYNKDLYNLFKEQISYVDDDMVYFDYNMQVGDTLAFVYNYDIGTGYKETYIIYGNIIKVVSIDTVNIQSAERLVYDLESKYFAASLRLDFDEHTDRAPDNYTYHYEINEITEPVKSVWIEGIGYTNRIGYTNNTLQCVFENGENIYTAEGAECDGLSDNINEKIDFSTLTLHRSGDVLMATFPTAGKGEAITLYDATGRVVTTQPIREGATTASIDVATLPDGIYIARLSNGSTAKVVL